MASDKLRLISAGVMVLALTSMRAAGARADVRTRGPLQAGQQREVRLRTHDGWAITGDLYRPKGRPRGMVVLLHQRGGSASDWRRLARSLTAEGIEALALDLRGTGRSTEGPGQRGDEAPWDTSGDIQEAVRVSQGIPVVLAGASYGANNALLYAAAHPDEIRGVVLFSPGINYHGLNGLEAARRFRGSVLVLHYRADPIAGDGPARIYAALRGKRAIGIYPGSGHGTDLLANSGATRQALTFLRACFAPAAKGARPVGLPAR